MLLEKLKPCSRSGRTIVMSSGAGVPHEVMPRASLRMVAHAFHEECECFRVENAVGLTSP